MTRYLILGASGLLGINLALQLSPKEDVVGTFYKKNMAGTPFRLLRADLYHPGESKRLIEIEKPEVVVNCAALADLDACEKQEKMAFRLNAQLPGELAQATRDAGIKLVHISTDAVFDGKRGNFTELDKPEPINVYARSKLAGEQAVVEGAPDAIIARVNFYGWSLDGQRSLAEWIYNNLSNKKPIQGFTDVLFCPLHVRDLGELLVQMVDIGLRGLYHVVSRECLSKYDFACRLAKEFGFDAALVQAASWASAGLTAPRSQNLTLNSDKLSRALGHPPPGINEGLRRFYQQHQRAYAQQIRGYLN